jgi:hypothetical protein
MNLKEKIPPKVKKILHEPLFYLLFLLAFAGLWIIPEKQNIKYVALIANGKSYSESFPISTHNILENTDFLISFYVDAKKGKKYIYKLYPDDCILSIRINGNAFPQERIKGACDLHNGTELNFSEFLREGSNKIDIQMRNYGGPGGLRVEKTNQSLKQLTFMHYVFALLFLSVFILILRKFKLDFATIFIILPFFCLTLYSLFELYCRLQYELSGPVNWDSDIYFAIGRGIVNGISPWSGLWDIKPPGIFLLSAISFKIFDSPVFCHWFQSFILIVLAFVPLAAHFVLPNRSVWRLFASCLFGLAISLYSAERAGEVQTESIGAGFAALSIFAFTYPNFYKRKILWIAVSAFGLLGACGFKEPFLFLMLGASILLCKDIKDWLTRFLLPLAIAIATGFLLLIIFGWLGDFLHYLDFMQQIHANRHGSPFQRAMQFWRLWEDLNGFSWGLGWAMVAMLFAPFVLYKEQLPNAAIKTLIAFLLASYAVGLGGEFFDHHFVFAVPFYIALWIMLLNRWNENNVNSKVAGSLILIILSIAILNLPDLNLEKREIEMTKKREVVLKEAAYVDAVLDKLQIDRYMHLGQNDFGNRQGTNFIFGRTRHSPKGPYFIQFQHVWLNEIPRYRETIQEMLENSQIVVRGLMPNHIADLTEPILNEYFTLSPWEEVADIPREYKEHRVYFRKR